MLYRQREPQLMLVPVDVNLLVSQVVDPTRARWCSSRTRRMKGAGPAWICRSIGKARQ